MHIELKVMGITLYQGLQDIMFYAKADDAKKLGGVIIELPDEIEDQKGRFINFNGSADKDWEKVADFYATYEALKQS
jgi:hypothetical protein